jgi:hypothetical protein
VSTDQADAPSKNKAPEKRAEADPTPRARPDSSEDGKTTEGETSEGGTQDDRPSRTEQIASVLTRASELVANEHALANANIALQINNVAAGQSAVLRRTSLGAETLRRVRHTFEAPPRLAEAWKLLAEQNLMLLGGSPGDGREYLATFLLDAFCDARVRLLSNGSIIDLADRDLTIGGGHLWLAGVGDYFDQRAAETLAGLLRRAGGYLIVVWPDDRELPPELDDYAIAPGRPDLDAVLRRHLREPAEVLLAEPAVAAVRHRLSSAQQATQLAKLIDRVVAGRSKLEDALAQVGGPDYMIADWFGDLPDREDQAFALALTALNDLSLPSVVAGARLADELIQQTEDLEGRSGLRPFRRPIRALLASVGADCVQNTRETGYGEVPITSVRLRGRWHAREILDALWGAYPYLQEIYLEWMDSLARHRDPYVRERVALVAGLLASHDFEFVRSRLLLDWASADDPWLRRAAATALRPPALDDSLREIVWGLLDQWATTPDDDRAADKPKAYQRLTAATALGAPVGGTDPVRALDLITQRLLPHISNHYDYDVWTATASAVSELFGDGGSSKSDVVLQRAAEWAESTESGPRNVAVVVLLGLAGKPPDRAAGDDRRLPPLLRATGRSPDNIDRAVVLWRQALGHSQLSTTALKALRVLADHVGDGEDGTAELIELIAAAPDTERERRTLIFEFRRWTEDDPHPPIAMRLHEMLSGGE